MGVWGHSMGACTCIMYAGNSGGKHISGMVLDSSFSLLDSVITETAALAKQRLGDEGGAGSGVQYVPDALIPLAISGIRRSIITQAQFDIRDVSRKHATPHPTTLNPQRLKPPPNKKLNPEPLTLDSKK